MSVEDKSFEIQFELLNHINNQPITSTTLLIYSKLDSSFNEELQVRADNGIVSVPIKYTDARKKLYVKLLNNSFYYSYPYPNKHIPIYPICYRRGKIQQVRFLPKDVVVGALKAYGNEFNSIYSSVENYLSNQSLETITIAQGQVITLKSYLMTRKNANGITDNNRRYFLNNISVEENISDKIHWAFAITENISGFSTTMPIQISSLLSAEEKFNELSEINIHTDTNTNRNIYKLMKSCEEITGHTINFRLSDIMSSKLLKENNLYDRYYIVFFSYVLFEDENEVSLYYNKQEDDLSMIELKIVSNKYSMIFDGYNLELYKNGKYLDKYSARLTNNGRLVNDIFSVPSTVNRNGLDDLYRCEAKLVSKMVDNMLRRVLYLRPYSISNESNYEVTDFIVDNIKLIDLENQLNTKKTKENIYNKVIHISSIDYIKLWHKIQFQNDVLVKFMYQPRYVIEVTRYREVYNSDLSDNYIGKRFGATYGVFAIYVYVNGEKYLLDSIDRAMALQNIENRTITVSGTSKGGQAGEPITCLNASLVNEFISIPINQSQVKELMNGIDFKSEATYSDLIYGGYTMEPAGPDNLTMDVKRRIPEGHYKGKFHTSNSHWKDNTMDIYNDMFIADRYILVHAGTNNLENTTGCILVSKYLYGTHHNVKLKNSKEKKELLYGFYKSLNNTDNRNNIELEQYINLVLRNNFNMLGE